MERRRTILLILLFSLAAVLVTIIIPSGGHYMQRYNVGEIWYGESLSAPFDFSLGKTEAEILGERREVERNFIPVYKYDSTVADKAVLNAAKVVDEKDMRQAERILRFIYRKGVALNMEKTSPEDERGLSYVRLDRNSVLETVSVSEVFTLGSAKEYFNRNFRPAAQDDDFEIDEDAFITANVHYDERLNAALKDRAVKSIPMTKGVVHEGELIVANNQVVDQVVLGKLDSLKAEYERRVGGQNSNMIVLLGHFMVVALIFLISFIFFYYFKNSFVRSINNVLFILLLYVLMVGLCSFVVRNEYLSVYLIPFAIVPVYILTFFDVRMSVYEHSTILLFCTLIVPKPTEFFFVNFIAGIVGVFIIKRSYRRERIFLAAGLIFLSNCVSYVAINLIQFGDFTGIDFRTLGWFVGNSLLFLGMYQLLYVIEKIFGFVSDVTLLELCDTNQKLLQELARKAPGTFQHTLQVANLCEAAAKEIGANPLLARAGAMYHDIGKMENPAYFIENKGGAFNPHDSMGPRQSAEIIRHHVEDGVALAHKYRLPKVVTEFISSHHGDSLIYYFYSAEKEKMGGTVDERAFRYPGPRPASREVSICMMADAVEAASRSMTDNTKEKVDELVDKVIDTQIKEKELSRSNLSFRDVGRIKGVFKKKLYNIYHTRIAYPERED